MGKNKNHQAKVAEAGKRLKGSEHVTATLIQIALGKRFKGHGSGPNSKN